MTRGVQDLRVRTREYALRIVNLYSALPPSKLAQTFGIQVLRSGTSVGAQWREAHRAKSAADFVSKLRGALGELDETGYWLELLAASGLVKSRRLELLMKETDELIAILVASINKAKPKSKA